LSCQTRRARRDARKFLSKGVENFLRRADFSSAARCAFVTRMRSAAWDGDETTSDLRSVDTLVNYTDRD
jgi:predicted NAD/FAD-binding protein